MAHIKRVLLKGYCYHLIIRGNQKQAVFKDRKIKLLIHYLLFRHYKGTGAASA